MLLDGDRRVDRRQQGAGHPRRAVRRRPHRGGARRWNDANVLAFGLRLTSETVADEMLDAFLTGEPDADEADNIARVE